MFQENEAPADLIRRFPGMHLKRKTSSEWAGPCMFCGGTDRFIAISKPNRRGSYHFYCRQCGFSGDLIDLARNLHYQGDPAGYFKALEFLGIERPERLNQRKKAASFPARRHGALPPLEWSERAEAFFANCQRGFIAHARGDGEADVESTLRLARRHLYIAGCVRCGIGYHDPKSSAAYEPRSKWGLDDDGKVRLPRGIAIATRRQGRIVALTIRLNEEDMTDHVKYWHVKGGAMELPFIAGRKGAPLVIVESALDAALLAEVPYCTTPGMVSPIAAIATMGSTKDIDAEARSWIDAAPLVIITPDNDEAGGSFKRRWQKEIPRAVVVWPVKAKDIGDMDCMFCDAWNPDPPPHALDWLEMALEKAREASRCASS